MGRIIKKGYKLFARNPLIVLMVGAAGFELATPCTPCKCATRLRYAPTRLAIIADPKGFPLRSERIVVKRRDTGLWLGMSGRADQRSNFVAALREKWKTLRIAPTQ